MATSSTSQWVVITGSSTGIGKASALELDRLGMRVFAGVRKPADAEALKAEASDRLIPLMLDVTDSDQIAAATEQVHAAVGDAGLHGLVNNAGIVVPGPLELLPLDKFWQQIEVNLVGQLAVTQAMLPMIRTARGRIVNVSSLNGAMATPYLGAYSASKHALEGLTDALRSELRNWGIAVSLVEPDSTATPIWEKSFARSMQMAEEASPEALKLYEADLDAMRKAAKMLEEGAMPVEPVVRAVVHALTSSRPKVRYYMNLRTRLVFRLLPLVPERIRDWIMRRELHLPEYGRSTGQLPAAG